MIHQLNSPIPVKTPKGNALAHAVIDYGIEHDIQWVCFQDSTGECWTWNNRDIRAQINITHGRNYISPFYPPSEVAFKNEKNEQERLCSNCKESEELEGNHICDQCGEPCEDDDFDWEASHDLIEQELVMLRKDLSRVVNERDELVKSHDALKDILKDLIKNDHIFPGKIDLVIGKMASCCPKETKESLYALQAGKTMQLHG